MIPNHHPGNPQSFLGRKVHKWIRQAPAHDLSGLLEMLNKLLVPLPFLIPIYQTTSQAKGNEKGKDQPDEDFYGCFLFQNL